MSRRKVAVPPVPAGLDPELRRFLESVRTHVLARDGQTGATRDGDDTYITRQDLYDLLPGLVQKLTGGL